MHLRKINCEKFLPGSRLTLIPCAFRPETGLGTKLFVGLRERTFGDGSTSNAFPQVITMIRRLWALAVRIKRDRYLGVLRQRGLKLGEDVSIEDGFFLDPSHCYLIEIRSRCMLAPNVRLIAHDASTKRLIGATRLGPILIEEGCFIGDSVIVLPGVTIGRGSIIGAGSIVTRSIPAGSVAAGNPARVLFPVDEYRNRQAGLLASGRKFSADYWIENGGASQREEILAAAARGDGFIV